jgi:alpha-galactosidase/6-phospho-beta-glucosidase family protein
VIWDKLGYFPAISDDHICEFFPQFLKNPEVRQHWSMHYDRLKERPKTMKRARETVIRLLAGKDPLHLEPSGEIIARSIAALHDHHDFIDVLNAPNVGQIPNLPEEAIVETKCVINRKGIQPLTAGPLPDLLESIVRPISIRHALYMEAVYEWNREKAAAALSTDPLVNDFINTKGMVDEYFTVNQQILEGLGMPVNSWQ